jgi:outer membrane murein-binding lipoprotein Lpp
MTDLENYELKLLRHLLTQELGEIMADISKLQAAVTQLQTDVTSLINKPTVPSQAEIDAVTSSVTTLDSQVQAALGTAPAP